MDPAPVATSADECFRCGYNLYSIPNENACPECGLLAERSRRVTDELHDSRPRWLKSISRGMKLILLSILFSLVWWHIIGGFGMNLFPSNPSLEQRLFYALYFYSGGRIEQFLLSGYFLGGLIFFAGILLLTRKEGYPPSDRADKSLRLSLRIVGLTPLVAVFLWSYASWPGPFRLLNEGLDDLQVFQFFIAIAMLSLIPFPLFLHLRGLARRARSAHLAEHCKIVGIGASASLFLFAALPIFIRIAHAVWGYDYVWLPLPVVPGILCSIPVIACFLFMPWSLYLLLRFAISFHVAGWQLQLKWKLHDRALYPTRRI